MSRKQQTDIEKQYRQCFSAVRTITNHRITREQSDNAARVLDPVAAGGGSKAQIAAAISWSIRK